MPNMQTETRQARGTQGGSRAEGHTRESKPGGAVKPRFALIPARDFKGFEIGLDRTDVRGWAVFSADGQLVGNVDALYIDPTNAAIRYLGITLGSLSGSMELIGRVMVPVGSSRRHGLRRQLILSQLTASHLAAAPRLRNRRVTRAKELATLRALGLATAETAADGGHYSSPLFDESALFAGDRVAI